MNGADALMQTLLRGGVDTCFMNPGTSEMHFVAALDRAPEMRSVLALFEGVVTGAADGYGRMTGRPAATLLHLGPGLGNGYANLHNARRAQTPLINIVGEHATYHRQLDAPLTSDIEGLAALVSAWVGTAESADEVGPLTAQAVVQSQTPPGQIATLVLPADSAWSDSVGPVTPGAPEKPPRVPGNRIDEIAAALRNDPKRTAIILGSRAMRANAVAQAVRLEAAGIARILGDRVVARVERGGGRPDVIRIPYPVDQATALMADLERIVLVGASPPVAFFAYPDKPGLLAPEGCEFITLARSGEDLVDALEALANALNAPATGPTGHSPQSAAPLSGVLHPDAIWQVLAQNLPENGIIVDEAVTSSRNAQTWTRSAPPHDWLHVTGGAIGQGLPVALGAAVACPDRRVFAMEADGSGFYTLQALWSQAREGLNVINVIFANRAYRILEGELARVGAGEAQERAARMLTLSDPDPDWVQIGKGMGLMSARADSIESFRVALDRAIEEEGPSLIEAVIHD